MSLHPGVSIRKFTHDDVDLGMELKNLAGWNQLRTDWERFLEWEPEGCFLAEFEGRPVGTAITIAYQDLFGWVGMVLVHPEIRRKGIGTGLLMACIEYLEGAGVAAVKLDATPMGKQLYDTIGFVDEYVIERHQAIAVPMGWQEGVRELEDADLDAVCALDMEAFGADRSRVLGTLHGEDDTNGFVVVDSCGLQGYILCRPGVNAAYVGPWVATSAQVAEKLLLQVLAARAEEPLFIDISRANEHAAGIIAAHGFKQQRHLIRQYRGENVSPGDTSLVFGVAGPEIG